LKAGNYFFSKLLIISGWVILILLAYKVSQFDYEYANFDLYEFLGVPLVSNELAVV
jgi:translocation protein SEC63